MAVTPPTARMVRFVEEYCIDFNGAAAAVRAGYAPDSARQTAYELLQDPRLEAMLSARRQAAKDSLVITAQRVQDQYARIAFADVTECLDEHGNWTNPKTWPENLRAALTSYEEYYDAEGNPCFKVKFADKLRALDVLAKVTGLVDGQADVLVLTPIERTRRIRELLGKASTDVETDVEPVAAS